MKKSTAIFLTIVLLFGCSKVPISNRKQLNLLPESEMMAMALTNYNGFLKTNPPLVGSSDAQLVKTVGMKIANAAQQYLKTHNGAKRIAGFKWEYNLVNSPEVNAWCMPGGKIVVYNGILSITQTEAGLATVISHEVSHAIARHGNERMSQGLIAQAGGIALDVYLSQKPNAMNDMYRSVYGIGANVGVLLPYGRMQESEADRMGLTFMAIAGYNPNDAIAFWERMKNSSKGASVPTFLSTHPDDDKRIADLKSYLPEAMKFYKGK